MAEHKYYDTAVWLGLIKVAKLLEGRVRLKCVCVQSRDSRTLGSTQCSKSVVQYKYLASCLS